MTHALSRRDYARRLVRRATEEGRVIRLVASDTPDRSNTQLSYTPQAIYNATWQQVPGRTGQQTENAGGQKQNLSEVLLMLNDDAQVLASDRFVIGATIQTESPITYTGGEVLTVSEFIDIQRERVSVAVRLTRILPQKSA